MNEKQIEIAEKLKIIMIENLRLEVEAEDITYDMPLFEEGLGLDSVDALEIVAGVDEEYGISLVGEDRGYFQNLETLSGYILKRLEEDNE